MARCNKDTVVQGELEIQTAHLQKLQIVSYWIDYLYTKRSTVCYTKLWEINVGNVGYFYFRDLQNTKASQIEVANLSIVWLNPRMLAKDYIEPNRSATFIKYMYVTKSLL